MKNLYLVSRTDSCGYDEFDSFVVCAENEEYIKDEYNAKRFCCESWDGTVSKDFNIEITLLGAAEDTVEIGAVLGSFNAG